MSVELVSLIIAFLTLLGSMVAVYVTMNVKIAEINVRVLDCENRLVDIKADRKDVAAKVDKSNDKIWDKLDAIEKMLNENFTNFAVLQNEHNKMICKFEYDNRK
jgi:hypothetical protein